MKALVFCNNVASAQIVFELIRKRIFAGLVIPSSNRELIGIVSDSGYVEQQLLFTPDPQDDQQLLDIVHRVQPDVCLVLAFPRIFSEELRSIPPLGFYNFHYGLLPAYRSADPIFWQIRRGEKEGGVTVHRMTSRTDAGPILFQETFPIHPLETYGSLLQKSAAVTCANTDEIIRRITVEEVQPAPQNLGGAGYYPKPGVRDVTIHWGTMNLQEIVATVNACNPWNKGAITHLDQQEIRILQVTPAKYDGELPDNPGQIFYADEQQGAFVICCDRQLLRLDALHSPLGFAAGGRLLAHGIIRGKTFENRYPPDPAQTPRGTEGKKQLVLQK